MQCARRARYCPPVVGHWLSATTSKRPSGSSRTSQLNDPERRSSFSRFALRRARAWSSVVIATAIGSPLGVVRDIPGTNVLRPGDLLPALGVDPTGGGAARRGPLFARRSHARWRGCRYRRGSRRSNRCHDPPRGLAGAREGSTGTCSVRRSETPETRGGHYSRPQPDASVRRARRPRRRCL
jgi:hypothetical protein